MRKPKAFFWIVFLVSVTAVFLYITNFRYKCEYGNWIKAAGNVIVKDFSDASEEDLEMPSCEVPITSCRGFTCMAPILLIQCGTSRDVCGQQVECDCINL